MSIAAAELATRPRQTVRQWAVGWLPEGRALPEVVWQRRHRSIVNFALLQGVALFFFGLVQHFSFPVVLGDFALIIVPAVAARAPHATRRARMLTATMALMISSAVFVDFAHGMTEAHFHFFVMVGVVALYQDWSAFGCCILMTVVHHAVMGTIVPRDVYGSDVEWRKPILWALVHGGFVLAVSVTHLIAWRASEDRDLADPLTQLPNRTAFNERLAGALTADDGHLDEVSVLFVDLDNFKRINDRLGHLVGDHALLAASERMTGALRDLDLLARLGGDEFAVMVAGPESDAVRVAARMTDVLQPPVVVDGREVFIRASIGVAGSDTVGSRDPKDLVRSADLAMYVAKSQGRNQVARYDAHAEQAARDRDQLRADLRNAVAHGQIHVEYQPIVSGDGERVLGVEALARWSHPTRGNVPPSDFIPLAEETGDIVPMGSWILKTAAAQIVAWERTIRGCADLHLAVNVSAAQLDDSDFVDTVIDVLATTGLSAHRLTLEITESMLVSDTEAAGGRLEQLRAQGIKIAIDDFGTGYSSLAYLAGIPADIVKIDQSFVADLYPQSGSRVLVQSIIELARSLGLDVVAEGVERTTQAELLRDLGCPQLQGYLYARPMNREVLAEYLTTLETRTPSAA
jgi:diguanylate cyclase (GGDEF)-like protein